MPGHQGHQEHQVLSKFKSTCKVCSQEHPKQSKYSPSQDLDLAQEIKLTLLTGIRV